MYEQVPTGPLYDRAVKLLSTYRSVAARMANASATTQGKLDRRLEALGEQAGTLLAELTDAERMALTCWQPGVLPDIYEIDHTAITARPYESIRRIDRWTEEYNPADCDTEDTAEDDQASASDVRSARLRSFLNALGDEGL